MTRSSEIRTHLVDTIPIVSEKVGDGAYLAYCADLDQIAFGHGFTREDAIEELLHKLKPDRKTEDNEQPRQTG